MKHRWIFSSLQPFKNIQHSLKLVNCSQLNTNLPDQESIPLGRSNESWLRRFDWVHHLEQWNCIAIDWAKHIFCINTVVKSKVFSPAQLRAHIKPMKTSKKPICGRQGWSFDYAKSIWFSRNDECSISNVV